MISRATDGTRGAAVSLFFIWVSLLSTLILRIFLDDSFIPSATNVVERPYSVLFFLACSQSVTTFIFVLTLFSCRHLERLYGSASYFGLIFGSFLISMLFHCVGGSFNPLLDKPHHPVALFGALIPSYFTLSPSTPSVMGLPVTFPLLFVMAYGIFETAPDCLLATSACFFWGVLFRVSSTVRKFGLCFCTERVRYRLSQWMERYQSYVGANLGVSTVFPESRLDTALSTSFPQDFEPDYRPVIQQVRTTHRTPLPELVDLLTAAGYEKLPSERALARSHNNLSEATRILDSGDGATQSESDIEPETIRDMLTDGPLQRGSARSTPVTALGIVISDDM